MPAEMKQTVDTFLKLVKLVFLNVSPSRDFSFWLGSVQCSVVRVTLATEKCRLVFHPHFTPLRTSDWSWVLKGLCSESTAHFP